MSYVDGFVAAVPEANKEKFIAHAKIMAAVFKDHGAISVVDTWGDDIPEGEVTSFSLAVKKEEGETIATSNGLTGFVQSSHPVPECKQ